MFFLALTAARTERFGRVARCKKNKQTLKHNDTYLSNLIGGGFGGRLGTVGGGKQHGETHVDGNEDERRQSRSQ